MKLIEGLRLEIGYSPKDIISKIAHRLKINCSDIKQIEILKESLDARRKPDVYYNLNVAFDTDKTNKLIENLKDVNVSHDGIAVHNVISKKGRPIIIGFGPAGMFMGLKLAKSGLNPIIIEQGDCVDIRKDKIQDFWNNAKLDIYSNVHFGEGGAGTFSDGKLNSNISNFYCKTVINEFILNGAPKEIFYKSKPHIGTDNLINIVKNIRQEIIKYGGEIYFNTMLEDFVIENNGVSGIVVKDLKQNKTKVLDCKVLILAVGHSAKKIFNCLKDKNVCMEQKPFAMGVRIEQKQKDINFAQYGSNDPRLPSADYKLVEHLPNGRSVFTFCMCPGGEVVASSSEVNTIVTNGMSMFSRNKENANSAILVNVNPEDFGSDDVLAGFEFQSKYEKIAYDIGGSNYCAPIQYVGDFLNNKDAKSKINPTYKPGVNETDISKCLPDFVAESIRYALPKFEKKIKNFSANGNVLTAIESRSSCPVQITRFENYKTNIDGLYAIGEGAGYAGGIMSSAQDGLKVAESVIEYLTT